MAKEKIKTLKLVIPAGKATPAPPLGPILGQNGIDIGSFTKEFNDKTREMGNFEIPVEVTVFNDRTTKLKFFEPTVVSMIKSKFKLEKGSATPNKDKIKIISSKDLIEIAERKMPDLNTRKIESAVKIVEGIAKSMGIEIKNS